MVTIKDVSKEVKLRAQNLLTILDSIVNAVRGIYMII